MKYLIVNGDDFGASRGINRGMIEVHQRGILTSTSLLVQTPYADEAAAMARKVPDLSVGLHADVRDALKESADGAGLREELLSQYERFEKIMGRPPTHLDSHHNVHLESKVMPYFLDLARERGLFLRQRSKMHYFSKFYGQWSGKTHLEQVSVEKFSYMLKTQIGDGITELCCHPGYVDKDHKTSYSVEREAELSTLCDPQIRVVLAEQAIKLVSYHDVGKLPVEPPTTRP